MAKRPAPPVTRGIMSDQKVWELKMSKAFWMGGILIGLGVGLALGSYSHPYEQCSRMYDTPEDIMECVWIKEN